MCKITKHLQNLGVILIPYHTHLGIGKGEVVFSRIDPDRVVSREVSVHGDADCDGGVLELLLTLHQRRCANHFLQKYINRGSLIRLFEDY